MSDNMSGEITFNILEYLLGGHCSFTLSQDSINGRPGMSKRYSISESNGFYFVHTDDRGSKKYLGFFRSGDLGNLKQLREGKRKSEGIEEGRPLVVILNSLQNKGKLPGNGVVHIISDGKCSACGRKLTDAASIHYGMGPTCRARRGL